MKADAHGPSIAVTGLAKRYDLTGPVPFAPARSIYNRVTGRRYEIDTAGAVETWVDEEELEEEDDLEEVSEEELRAAPGAARSGYAIRDVSFEVAPGVALAVLGGPGAGKTTLIRVLAGISSPTAGTAILRGVVAAPPQLLSTFMRPDLSIGQNLRLAGRLFGIPARVVRDRTPAILDFAGMHAKSSVDPRGAGDAFRRLGMAIAVGVRPDVLLLDEIPSVTDQEYGSRFVESLRELSAGGTAILFATRSEASAAVVCDEALTLEEGRVTARGPVPDDGDPRGAPAAAAATRSVLPEPDATVARSDLRPGGRTHPLLPVGKPGWPGIGFHQWAALLSVHVRDASGAEVSRVTPEDELVVEFGVEIGVRALDVHWQLSFLAQDGADISVEEEAPRRYGERTVSMITVRIAPGTLRPGTFVGRVDGLISAVDRTYEIRRDAFALVVEGEEAEAAGPVVADLSASTWSVRGVPSPELVLTRQ